MKLDFDSRRYILVKSFRQYSWYNLDYYNNEFDESLMVYDEDNYPFKAICLTPYSNEAFVWTTKILGYDNWRLDVYF